MGNLSLYEKSLADLIDLDNKISLLASREQDAKSQLSAVLEELDKFEVCPLCGSEIKNHGTHKAICGE